MAQELNVPFWSRSLSLVLLGSLTVSSARSFILVVASGRSSALSVGGTLGKFASMTAATMAPLTTLLLGAFLISTLLLLRVNVPCQYRNGLFASVKLCASLRSMRSL